MLTPLTVLRTKTEIFISIVVVVGHMMTSAAADSLRMAYGGQPYHPPSEFLKPIFNFCKIKPAVWVAECRGSKTAIFCISLFKIYLILRNRDKNV